MPKATPGLIITESIITETAPMLRKFKGQSEDNVRTWAKKNNFTVNEIILPDEEGTDENNELYIQHRTRL
jgi:hypothetical protein